MRALSELFDSTTLLVPVDGPAKRPGDTPLTGHDLSVVRLTVPHGEGLGRKAGMVWWLLLNSPRLLIEAARADVIHTPIPGDVGTFGMVLAVLLGKPLFVRHCGNWEFQRTLAERFWRWFMERFAGGRNVMFATGGSLRPPSPRNPEIGWIFSSSLTKDELATCRKERRSINSAGARLITVCRQERFKGTDVLIKSLSILLQDFPGLTLDVVGDGGALAELKRLATGLGLNDSVRFHGQLSHDRVIELLKNADLFCYPTRSDGFPKAVLEALACGLPVVTTPVSVLPQLIGNGSGLVIEKASPEDLARAVSECLSDSQRYSEMSTHAVKTAENYSLERWRDLIGESLRKAGLPLRSDA